MVSLDCRQRGSRGARPGIGRGGPDGHPAPYVVGDGGCLEPLLHGGVG